MLARPHFPHLCHPARPRLSSTVNIDRIRALCVSLPHVTEKVQWGDDLVFKVAGKMFCVVYMGVPATASFKVPEEQFHELIENEDVIPAPYMARAGWIQMKRLDALPAREIEALIHYSYEFYFAKLPKKVRESLGKKPAVVRPKRRSAK